MSDGWYTGLMLTANAAATAVNIVGPKCFKEGTLVKTKDGDKKIEDIEVGDMVLSYDEETGEQAYKRVVRLFRNETKEWCHVHIEGMEEPIVSTPGHKYYLPENTVCREIGEKHEHAGYDELSVKWVSACNLKKGDKVLLSDGKYGIVKAIKLEQLSEPETTYNFEVADFHSYYVGEQGILVHNECGIKPTQKGIDNVKKHLSTMDDFYANVAMVGRIENALANGQKIYGADKNFYMHELKEMMLMKGGMSYGAAHDAALSFYNVSRYSLYHPEVIMMQPSWWSPGYFNYWGIG